MSSSTSFTYFGFPLYLPEYQDVDVRRALSMAIDRDLIVEQIYANTRVAAFSTLPPIFQGAREHVCDNWDYNPEGRQGAVGLHRPPRLADRLVQHRRRP